MSLVKKLQLNLHDCEIVKMESKTNMPFYKYKSYQNATTYYTFINILLHQEYNDSPQLCFFFQ